MFPDGRAEDVGKPKRTKAFSDGVTYEATQILEQNVQGGTGTAAQIGCPAAGKTGTTDNFNDAWFVGFTPKLATSVWVGYPKAQIEMRSVHGISVAGGTFPAEIWDDYMRTARGDDCSDFEYPKDPASFSPFFGKYAGTGGGGGSYDYGTNDGQSTDPKTDTGGTGTQGGTGDYPSGPYESPPQAPPTTVTPTPAPSTSGGGGGGNSGGGGGGTTGGGTAAPG